MHSLEAALVLWAHLSLELIDPGLRKERKWVPSFLFFDNIVASIIIISKSINYFMSLILIETRLVQISSLNKRFLVKFSLVRRACKGDYFLLLFNDTTLFGFSLLLANFELNFRDCHNFWVLRIFLLSCFSELIFFRLRLSWFWLMRLPAELRLFLISLELLVAELSELVTWARDLAATLAGVCFFSLVAAATCIPIKSDFSVALSIEGRLWLWTTVFFLRLVSSGFRRWKVVFHIFSGRSILERHKTLFISKRFLRSRV